MTRCSNSIRTASIQARFGALRTRQEAGIRSIPPTNSREPHKHRTLFVPSLCDRLLDRSLADARAGLSDFLGNAAGELHSNDAGNCRARRRWRLGIDVQSVAATSLAPDAVRTDIPKRR